MANFSDLKDALTGISNRVGFVKDDTTRLLAKISELQQNPPTGMSPDQQAALDEAVSLAQGISGRIGEIDDLVPAAQESVGAQPVQPGDTTGNQPQVGDQTVDNSGNQPLPTGSIDNPVTGEDANPSADPVNTSPENPTPENTPMSSRRGNKR